MQKYFKNSRYNIVETLSQGDCFFDTINIATKGKYDVESQREILVNNFKIQDLIHYKTLYYNALVIKNSKFTGNREQDRLLRKEKENAKTILDEFKQIGNIETLDQMHSYIRTNKFWADSWAIGTIEKELNLKFIILSEEEYESRNIDNVLQCGDMNISNSEPQCAICNITKSEYEYILNEVTDERQLREMATPYLEAHNIKIEPSSNLRQLLKDCEHAWIDKPDDNSDYNPNGYIILTYSGDHYRLVTYNKKGFFNKFSEIPNDLRSKILKNCKNVGLYKRIPEIRTKKKVAKGIKKAKFVSKKKKGLFSFLF